jgi:hypothetical protein
LHTNLSCGTLAAMSLPTLAPPDPMALTAVERATVEQVQELLLKALAADKGENSVAWLERAAEDLWRVTRGQWWRTRHADHRAPPAGRLLEPG